MHRAASSPSLSVARAWWLLLACWAIALGSGCTTSSSTADLRTQTATAPSTLQSVRPTTAGPNTQVIITTSGAVQPLVQRAAQPDRLVIDLPYTHLPTAWHQREMAVADGRLRAIQTTPQPTGGMRVTLLLQAIRDYRVGVQSAPHRVVVELFGAETSARLTPARPPASASPRKRAPRLGPLRHGQAPVIVIDPGHGGHDPGAIGPTGLLEKTVVLQIARALRQRLQQEFPKYRVVLTRDKDVFIPLGQRVQIANEHQALVFISIHANSSTNRDARGIETWYLSFGASARAKQIAARENRLAESASTTALERILHDMHETDRINQSAALARTIQHAVVVQAAAHYPDVVPRGVEGAPFVVLHRTEMPSILVETAFISHPEEEARLRSPHYHRVLAQGIVQGLRQFLQTAVVAQQ